MTLTADNSVRHPSKKSSRQTAGERGAALVTAILLLALFGAIAMTVLAVVHTEARIAGSDLERTQTFYAAASGVEKMTSDFSALFLKTSRPSAAQLSYIAASSPPELVGEGFALNQNIGLDNATLIAMRTTQNITNGAYPRVTIPSGPFTGLTASVAPYTLNTTATAGDGTQVSLTRQMNNYQIPLFQFGIFSNEDVELHPGPAFTFNGRVHANGNIYVNGNVTFLAKVTTANELITDVLRNGSVRTGTVSMQVGSINVAVTKGSMTNGPNITTATIGQRGYFPGSPNGTINSSWNATSVASAVTSIANQFGGQLLTRTTGAVPLRLPLELDDNPTRELIRRAMPNDTEILGQSRYHAKAEIRILIDDENPSTADAAGIPAGQGVRLSTFDPLPLPNATIAAGGGRALWRINDSGAYTDTSSTCLLQQNLVGSPTPSPSPTQALTVRSVKSTTQSVTLNGTNTKIPAGAGLSGRILIQIVAPNGTTYDVTSQVLSMGMTEGEPNAIVNLQRPLWAAFTQGSRDASNTSNPALNGDPTYTNSLADILNNTHIAADGEIKTSPGPTQDSTYGYLTGIVDDTASGSQPRRSDTPPSNSLSTLLADWGTSNWTTNKAWNAIVPINIYNVREGSIDCTLSTNAVYERGITNVVELNMRNLARWMDGVYDTNLLAGTNAVSTNLAQSDGYVVYVSDRRGDKVKAMVDLSGANINSSNGMVDNEDIFGPNGLLDPGEDVQNTGVLVKDTTELPDPATLAGAYGTDRNKRALTVADWTNPSNYFRGSVRLFNGEDLQISGAAGRLSSTLGITVATENMVYIWGNYNTTGINGQPPGAATLNDSTQTFFYLGNQVPASIVADAFFPLSKTWFDSSSAINPDDLSKRLADLNLPLPGVLSETSVRAGIIAGNNLSALAGIPDAGNGASGESRLSGGMHNFPRFLENWNSQRWNFVGSLIPLYHSTQALGPYNANCTIYSPPKRNWAFDTSFQNLNRLPPGTPEFEYIEPTAFRQVL